MSEWHRLVGPDQGRLRRWVLVNRARYKCEKCGHRITAGRASRLGSRRCELHHVKPLSEGGRHSLDNVLLLCVDCHLSIHRRERMAKLPLEVRQWAAFMQSC